MGGMGGTYDLAGGTGTTPLTTYSGSRSAVTGDQQVSLQQQMYDAFNSWLSSQAPPTTPVANAASPVVTNPVAEVAPAAATREGFTHTPYPATVAGDLPHIGGPATVVAPPVTPAEPVAGPMRQIWPSGSGTASSWLAANPNWETDFNRAEQHADGTWWVPQDPNEKRPKAGPQYYQGTGNVTYMGSPPASGGR